MLPVGSYGQVARLLVVALLLLLPAIMIRDIPADPDAQTVVTSAAAPGHLSPDCDERGGGAACCSDLHCLTQVAAMPGGMGSSCLVRHILPAPPRELTVAAANCANSTFEPPRIAA